jgi:ABC-type nitrate/sulfonate/bicarbonate transport system substrate-binding protein
VGHIGTGSDLPVYVAIERGYFQEEGLEIEAVDFRTSAEMVAPLAAGQLDVGLGGVNAGLFNSVAQGIPLKIVADKAVNTPSDKSTAWMARTDLLDSGQLKEPRDLKGLAVGVASPGSPGDIELDRMLRSGGLTRDDVEIKPIPYADQPVAFANKSIDLAYVFEPTRTRLLEQGIARVWHTSGEVYPNHESVVVIFGPSIDEKPEAGRRFMVGYLRGVRAVRDEAIDRREQSIIDIAVKWTAIKDAELWRKMELQQANVDGYNYRESLEADLSWFASNGFVQRPPRLDDSLDQSYVDYAVGRLGRRGEGR